jgi:hypothetical protein
VKFLAEAFKAIDIIIADQQRQTRAKYSQFVIRNLKNQINLKIEGRVFFSCPFLGGDFVLTI